MAAGSPGTGAAHPVAFGGCAGWLHPAAGGTAVLLLSPWGYEALCFRRSWRMLGDALAAAGYPTLRFDYPGAGDSLDDVDDATTLRGLAASCRRAARALQSLCGARRIVLIGQGLGATLAGRLGEELDAAAVGLLAPVVRGREHLRELSVWGLALAEAMRLATDEAKPGWVAGFPMPEPLRAEIAGLDLASEIRFGRPALLVGRGKSAESRLAERLREQGCDLLERPYDGYELAAGNPTVAQPPRTVIQATVDWLSATVPPDPGAWRPLPTGAVLEAMDFVETTVRFGPDERLCGVLCEPRRPRRGATVLMLGAGGDAHYGWARGAVEQARLLARDGIASFRMDATDVGDAAGPLSDQPPRLYDERHVDDACAGFDWLLARGLGPVLPVGRCSGAFAAFNAAARDERIADIILVNQQRFIWDREGEFELASEKVSHYRKQARRPLALLMRWARGQIDIPAALSKLLAASLTLGGATLRGKARERRRQIRDAFGALGARRVRVRLLISPEREAHDSFREFFGREGRHLRRYGDLQLTFLEGADHALTTRASRDQLLDVVREVATSPALVTPGANAKVQPIKRRDFAVRRRPGVMAV